MPFYEFECPCGNVSEELVKLGTETIICPKCGNTAKKIMSACTFSLKGGGWYADGYASKNAGVPSSPPKTETKSSDTPTTP